MRAFAIISALALAACAMEPPEVSQAPMTPSYEGVQTRLLDGDLVGFIVKMRGTENVTDATRYAECAAAQYTLIRGYGFLRHVRTTAQSELGLWSVDAAYVISPSLPDGLKTIDAEIIVGACADDGIPTV